MKASQDVSRQYDKIMDFFEELKTFLERLQMLEGRLPQIDGYRSHLVRVFAAIMKVSGVATRVTREGRLKRFGKTILTGGEDPELTVASAALEASMKRLEAATGTATLAVVQDVKGSTKRLEDSSNIIAIATRDLNASVKSSHSEMVLWFQSMSAQFDSMKFQQSQNSESGMTAEAVHKAGPGYRRLAAFITVNERFPANDRPNKQQQEIDHVYILGTGKWLLAHRDFVFWTNLANKCNIVWLWGSAGMGKSCLAHTVASELRLTTASHSNTSVACVFLRDFHNDEDPLYSVVCAIINQVARLDIGFCKRVATNAIKADAAYSNLQAWHQIVSRSLYIAQMYDPDWTQTAREKVEESAKLKAQLEEAEKQRSAEGVWQEHIIANFAAHSSSRLFLVLDGLDEIPSIRDTLISWLTQISSVAANIRVFATSREPLSHQFQHFGEGTTLIETERALVANDMKLLVQNRIQSSSSLYKYREQTKQLIADTILEKADGMLFVEHAIYLLDALHREQLVLSELKSMSKSLEALFDHLDELVRAKRRPQQIDGIRTLFAWLAFVNRPLSVSDAESVVRLRLNDPFFNIEEVLFGASGAILQVVDLSQSKPSFNPNIFESSQNDNSAVLVSENATNVDTIGPESAVLSFRDTSLREYFTSASKEDASLRSPRNSSHVTILITMVKLLCDISETELNHKQYTANHSLMSFAARNWLHHLESIELGQLRDAEICGVLQVMEMLATNTNNVTNKFERFFNDSTGEEKSREAFKWACDTYQSLVRVMQPWIMKGSCINSELLGPQVVSWLDGITANASLSLNDLAAGHLKNFLSGSDRNGIAYGMCVAAYNETNLTQHISPDNLLREFAIEEIAKQSSSEHDEIAHRALGVLFSRIGRNAAGMRRLNKSLAMSEDELSRAITLTEIVESSFALATSLELQPFEVGESMMSGMDVFTYGLDKDESHISRDSYKDDLERPTFQDVYSTAQTAIDLWRSLGGESYRRHVRRCLMRQAECQGALNNTVAMYVKLDEARHELPNELDRELTRTIFQCMHSYGDSAEIISQVKKWNLFEIMAWLNAQIWAIGKLQSAGRDVGEEAFVVKTLHDVVQFQELRGDAVDTQFELACLYLDGYTTAPDYLETAQDLLYKVIGSETTSHLLSARNMRASVLYERFRLAADFALKHEILDQMREFQEEGMSTTLHGVIPEESATAIPYSLMLRKLGKSIEFQQVLSQVFDGCMTTLSDADAENDTASLLMLAKVLACLGGLERDAQIAYSAIYSALDPAEKLNQEQIEEARKQHVFSANHDFGENAQTTEPCLPISECGDLFGDRRARQCRQCLKELNFWRSIPNYLCVICLDTELCRDCFRLWREFSQGKRDRVTSESTLREQRCGKNHKYIRGPMEGWRGIQNGQIVVLENEKEQRTEFKAWLTDLKERKWQHAWEEYARSEDGVVDVF